MIKKIFLSIISIFMSTSIANGMQRSSKVVILGGGISGLTAAHHLAKTGIIAQVVEGRNRLGGRLLTHYFDEKKSAFVEEGGTVIDDDHKDVIALAKEMKVPLRKVGFGTRNLFVYDKGHRVNLDHAAHELTNLEGFLAKLSKEVKEDSNPPYFSGWHPNPLAKYTAPLSPFNHKFLKALTQAEEGVPFEKSPVYSVHDHSDSVKGYMKLLHTKGTKTIKKPMSLLPGVLVSLAGYHYVAQNGMSSFIAAIETSLKEKQVPILLNHKLTHVSKKGDKYRLSFESASDIEADYIIMTLPFSTLRDVKIDESVHLEPETRNAIKSLPYGTNSKIGVQVLEPANITEDLLYYMNLDTSTVGWPGEKALTLYISAKHGRHLTPDSAQRIFKEETQHIMEAYPSFKFAPNLVVTNWSADPYSKGSYAAITTDFPLNLWSPSQKYEVIYKYAEPVDDNHFIFAGEHTRHDDTLGHIEGAVRSGILAAQILRSSLK